MKYKLYTLGNEFIKEVSQSPVNFTGIIEYSNGAKEWFVDGKRHRTDDPACEYSDGSKHWFVDGKQHRTDGPASEYSNGSKHWYVDGKLRRTDGPASEYSNGSKYWFVDGKQVTKEQHDLLFGIMKLKGLL